MAEVGGPIISLGAGVQSSTMILLAARGELCDGVMPAGAIFADTGWEPKQVYEHLDWLEGEVGDAIPIHRVTAGNIRDDTVKALETGEKWIGMPLHIENPKKGPGQL